MSALATREVSSATCRLPKSVPYRLGSSDHGPALRQRGLHVVAQVAGHAGQLPDRAEVADEREVRVGGAARTGLSSCCAAAIRISATRISAVVRRTPGGADPDVAPPGEPLGDRLVSRRRTCGRRRAPAAGRS